MTGHPDAFSANVSPSFSFTSSETGSTFECKMDTNHYQSCSSPKQHFLLSEGQHTFQVRAKNANGDVDPVPAKYTWTVDSLEPKVTFTQRPGNATGPDRWDEWVTNDRSPTWTWTVEGPNLDSDLSGCDLCDDINNRYIFELWPCSSPLTFEGELPDGYYYFDVTAYDKADNSGDALNYFEVDTAAPKFVSGKPTGRRVSTYPDVTVTFDNFVYGSKQFVNICKKGSSTPVAVYRYYGDGYKIELETKRILKSDTWYTVKVTTGVNGGANNLEAPYSWNFKTK